MEEYVDKLKERGTRKIGLSEYEYAVYPTSWHPDEPIEWIVETWSKTITDTKLVITGRPNPKRLERVKKFSKQDRIILTGFLDDEDYYCLLNKSKYVISATTSHLDMQCSAYEALAFGKAILSSRSLVLYSILKNGAVYFSYDISSFIHAVRILEENLGKYKKASIERARELKIEIERSLNSLKRL